MKRSFVLRNDDIRDRIHVAVDELPVDGSFRITIEPYRDDKTAEQRGYFHVLLGILSAETGHTVEELKQLVKKEAFGSRFVSVKGREVEVLVSSEKLSRDQYGALIDTCHRIGADLGVALPDPRFSSHG